MTFDYPWPEVVSQVTAALARGAKVYQKFTCAGCGERLTIPTPNKLYRKAECEHCNVVTNIEHQGCNYMLVLPEAEHG